MYRAEVTHTEGYAFKVKTPTSEMIIDAKGRELTPPDALLVSLGSCIGVYIRKYAEGARLAISAFTVTVEGDFSKQPPICFREIKVDIDLKGAKLDERRKKALVDFLRNCPVHTTLKINPRIDMRIL